jgi:cytochrome c biogenesis protein CcmG/thiol:disulfide interchange protein DsbE
MTSTDTPNGRQRGYGFLAPLIIFVAMAGLFAYALRAGDPSKLPSVFIGKPAPVFAFTPLEGQTGSRVNGFDQTALASGQVTVVNFWASWCTPCIEEHPLLVEIKKEPGVVLAGVNTKDEPVNAKRFLTRYGNPFDLLGQDLKGRGAIEWGVYGTPETFVVNGKGQIIYKHVGPISKADLDRKIRPAIAAARRG